MSDSYLEKNPLGHTEELQGSTGDAVTRKEKL
jgi:hypothetical protein